MRRNSRSLLLCYMLHRFEDAIHITCSMHSENPSCWDCAVLSTNASMRLTRSKTLVATGTRSQAACRRSQPARAADLGAQAPAHPCRQNRAGRDSLLVACTALWPARRLLGRHQRHHCPAVQLRRHDLRVARPDSWNPHRRDLRLRFFSLRRLCRGTIILAVFFAVIVCGLLGLRNSSRLAGVTISIVMLVQSTGSHRTVALHRVGEVFLGIVVAVAVSTLVFPDRARLRLRDGLAQEFLVLECVLRRQFCKAFAASRRRIWPICAKMPWPCCAATMHCWRSRAMNPPAARAGARGSECWRSLAAPSSMRWWRWNSLCKTATKTTTRSSWSPRSAILSRIFNQVFSTWRSAFTAGDFMSPPATLNLEDDIAQLEDAHGQSAPYRLQLFAGRNSARLCCSAAPQADCPPAPLIARGNQPCHRRGAGSATASQEICAGLPRSPQFP